MAGPAFEGSYDGAFAELGELGNLVLLLHDADLGVLCPSAGVPAGTPMCAMAVWDDERLRRTARWRAEPGSAKELTRAFAKVLISLHELREAAQLVDIPKVPACNGISGTNSSRSATSSTTFSNSPSPCTPRATIATRSLSMTGVAPASSALARKRRLCAKATPPARLTPPGISSTPPGFSPGEAHAAETACTSSMVWPQGNPLARPPVWTGPPFSTPKRFQAVWTNWRMSFNITMWATSCVAGLSLWILAWAPLIVAAVVGCIFVSDPFLLIEMCWEGAKTGPRSIRSWLMSRSEALAPSSRSRAVAPPRSARVLTRRPRYHNQSRVVYGPPVSDDVCPVGRPATLEDATVSDADRNNNVVNIANDDEYVYYGHDPIPEDTWKLFGFGAIAGGAIAGNGGAAITYFLLRP